VSTEPEAPAAPGVTPAAITEAELEQALVALAAITRNGNNYYPELARNIFGYVAHHRAPGPLVMPPGELEAASLVAAIPSPSPASPEPVAAATGPDGALPAERHMDLLESAWGVIANAGWDDCAKTTGWQEAAERWRDDYHRWLDLHLRPGGYQTWEELAVGLVRERDALFAEVAQLRQAVRDYRACEPVAPVPAFAPGEAVSAEKERAEAAEAKVLEYENAITWNTTCLSCSAVLDSAIAETFRREQAEAKLAATAAYCRQHKGEAGFSWVRALDILAITGSEEEARDG